MVCDQKFSHPDVAGFLDRCFRYISEATQISHDAVLEPVTYTGRKFLPTGFRTSSASHSTSSKQRALNCATKEPGHSSKILLDELAEIIS